METLSLNGSWRLIMADGRSFEGTVPGSVYSILLENHAHGRPFLWGQRTGSAENNGTGFRFRKKRSAFRRPNEGMPLRFFCTVTGWIRFAGFLSTDGMPAMPSIFTVPGSMILPAFSRTEKIPFGWKSPLRSIIFVKWTPKSTTAAPANPCGDFLIFENPTVCLAGTGVPACLMPVSGEIFLFLESMAPESPIFGFPRIIPANRL